MRKTFIAASIATAAFAVPNLAAAQAAAPAAAAPASPHTFTGNFTLASEYLYRGIAQTRGNPAVQGGFDYSHASGFYVGTWASNISWIQDAGPGANAARTASAPIEIDVYGGYKGTITGDFGYDLGVLTYNYPGSNKLRGAGKPDTTELYGAVSYKWLSLKYSHTLTSLFGFIKDDGVSKTKGSGYLDLSGNWDMGNGYGLTAHVGHQSVKGLTNGGYTDWKLGVTKDLGFGTVGLAYSATNAKDNCAAGAVAQPFCFGNVAPTATTAAGAGAYSSGKDRLLLTFGKTF